MEVPRIGKVNDDAGDGGDERMAKVILIFRGIGGISRTRTYGRAARCVAWSLNEGATGAFAPTMSKTQGQANEQPKQNMRNDLYAI